MAEAFKNWINTELIQEMAQYFKGHYKAFDSRGFIADASKNLDDLELKQRTQRITDTMITYLPDDFPQAGKILLASLGAPLMDESSYGVSDASGISGWAILSLTRYVAERGQGHFELSMSLLREMTMRETSEFDIRFFLTRAPQKTLAMMRKWTGDKNQHVRRLVSEGSRPRLPWGMQLKMFVDDPAPIIPLLELLKDDESEYVRRSVANNLNDIAKDHPDVVVRIAAEWMQDASPQREKLVRHACRTLLKNGHKKALAIFGYKKPQIESAEITLSSASLHFGESIFLELMLASASPRKQALMIDYVVHHQKANGTRSAKIFKWRTVTLAGQKTLCIEKKHSIKKISTRKYYSGVHTIEVIINGVSCARADFDLIM